MRKLKNIFLYLSILFISFTAKSQCTQVKENGSVDIIFATAIQGTVSKEVNGNWNVIGNINGTVFTDNNSNANSSAVKYKINDGTTDYNITTLYIDQTTDASGNITINLPNLPLYSSVTYAVYRKISDDWSFVGSITPNISFTENRPTDCKILYNVQIDEYGCKTISNTVEILPTDNQAPSQPILNGISIDINSQNLIVSWQASPDNDVLGYEICKRDNNSGIRLTLGNVDANTTTYTCSNCSVTDINQISVFAYDLCRNSSPNSNEMTNIVLQYDQKGCNEPIKLLWNHPMNTSFQYTYNIYMSDGGTYQLINTTTDTNYEYNVPLTSGLVKFYVAYSINNIEYYSNVCTINNNKSATLDYIYLKNASVSSDNMRVSLIAQVDNSKKVEHFLLYRLMDEETNWQMVKEIAYNGDSLYYFDDLLEHSASLHTYNYYLSAPDVCSLNYTDSKPITTMQINIEEEPVDKIKLSWNKPNAWDVAFYDIYRYSQNDINNAQFIGSTTQNIFYDDKQAINSSTDRVFYYIQAVENGSSIFSYPLRANSSNNYVKFSTILFIPNAFIPKDDKIIANRIFKPVCYFIRTGSYRFEVFNRYGQLLFQTDDTSQGWDGTFNGKYCPIGSYVYKISYTDSDGMEQNKSGVFMLLE